MIVDRFFNPKENVFSVAADIIILLQNEKAIAIPELFSRMDVVHPGCYDNYVFEAMGLLFLTGKIELKNADVDIGLVL